MSIAVLIVCAVAIVAFQAFVCYTLRKALEASQAENKRLLAIITAPTPNAAHAAALDRPQRERNDERPIPPVGG